MNKQATKEIVKLDKAIRKQERYLAKLQGIKRKVILDNLPFRIGDIVKITNPKKTQAASDPISIEAKNKVANITEIYTGDINKIKYTCDWRDSNGLLYVWSAEELTLIQRPHDTTK